MPPNDPDREWMASLKAKALLPSVTTALSSTYLKFVQDTSHFTPLESELQVKADGANHQVYPSYGPGTPTSGHLEASRGNSESNPGVDSGGIPRL